MKYLILALSLLATLVLSGCVVQTVMVVVTATPEPLTPIPEITLTATVTATPPPPPTATATTTPQTPTGPTPLPPGFPTPVVGRILVAEQVFEHGRMFWLEPIREIWVIMDQGNRWSRHPDVFEEGEPEHDPTLTPPAGLQQPIRGFGKLWREDDDIRATLGWAKDVEYGYTTDYRYDHGGSAAAGGTYTPGPGRHTLITLGNEVLHFYEADSSWRFE